MKGNQPTLLIASDVGLYELAVEPEASPVQILVTADQTQGFYSVGVAVDALGARNVAVAAQETRRRLALERRWRPEQLSQNRPRRARTSGSSASSATVPAPSSGRAPPPRAAMTPARAPGAGSCAASEDPPEGWVAFGQQMERRQLLGSRLSGQHRLRGHPSRRRPSPRRPPRRCLLGGAGRQLRASASGPDEIPLQPGRRRGGRTRKAG